MDTTLKRIVDDCYLFKEGYADVPFTKQDLYIILEKAKAVFETGGYTMMEATTLHELRKRFHKEFPEEAGVLENPNAGGSYNLAAQVWRGYKGAFKSLGILKE